MSRNLNEKVWNRVRRCLEQACCYIPKGHKKADLIEFLTQNEFQSAWEWLRDVAEEAKVDDVRFWKLMAQAAAETTFAIYEGEENVE